jgi:quinol monooxygenase YgiN
MHEGEKEMNKVGILATLQARHGKERDVEEFLSLATPLVDAEVGTTAWFAFRLGPATFGIFDTFRNEEGRTGHVNGEVAKALFSRAEELFVTRPHVQMVDIVSEKSSAWLETRSACRASGAMVC